MIGRCGWLWLWLWLWELMLSCCTAVAPLKHCSSAASLNFFVTILDFTQLN